MNLLRRRPRDLHPVQTHNHDGTLRQDIDHRTGKFLEPRRCGCCGSTDVLLVTDGSLAGYPANEAAKDLCRSCGAWHYFDWDNINDGWHYS